MTTDESYFGKEFAGRVLLALFLFFMLVLVVESFLAGLTLPAIEPQAWLTSSSATANEVSLNLLWDENYRAIDVLIQGLILLAASLAVAAQFRRVKPEKEEK
ncbi:MAG: hypothetical protein ACXAB4_10670 [Candidatus Hodarchaeales archaeon]|jgi:hypothetical protein